MAQTLLTVEKHKETGHHPPTQARPLSPNRRVLLAEGCDPRYPLPARFSQRRLPSVPDRLGGWGGSHPADCHHRVPAAAEGPLHPQCPQVICRARPLLTKASCSAAEPPSPAQGRAPRRGPKADQMNPHTCRRFPDTGPRPQRLAGETDPLTGSFGGDWANGKRQNQGSNPRERGPRAPRAPRPRLCTQGRLLEVCGGPLGTWGSRSAVCKARPSLLFDPTGLTTAFT